MSRWWTLASCLEPELKLYQTSPPSPSSNINQFSHLTRRTISWMCFRSLDKCKTCYLNVWFDGDLPWYKVKKNWNNSKNGCLISRKFWIWIIITHPPIPSSNMSYQVTMPIPSQKSPRTSPGMATWSLWYQRCYASSSTFDHHGTGRRPRRHLVFRWPLIPPTWMSQEVGKWLGSMGDFTPMYPIYITNFQRDIQVKIVEGIGTSWWSFLKLGRLYVRKNALLDLTKE